MSRLADAIRRSQRVEAAPMGFGAARPAPKATMLVGYLSAGATNVDKALEAGADVVLVKSNAGSISAGDLEALKSGAAATPAGVWGSDGRSDELQKGGVDFLVVEPEKTPAAALLNEELGYVLVLPDDPDELLLRSLEPLSFDAVYLNSIPSPFTVAKQIALTRIASLTRKPIACSVKADQSKDDLQCLRAAGVALVLVEGDAAGVKQLKETMQALPPRRQRRDERPVVSLPRGQVPSDEDDDGDD
jgi:hypothetical protein